MLVRQVMAGQPADQGGVKANDVVMAVNGTRVDGPRDLQRIISSTPVGETVKLKVWREGKETEVAVTVGAYQQARTRRAAAHAADAASRTAGAALTATAPQVGAGGNGAPGAPPASLRPVARSCRLRADRSGGRGARRAAQVIAIFPSDRYTVADPAQRTGRRVVLPEPSCPVDPSGCDEVALLNQLDGFSVHPRLALTFDEPITVESVTREAAFILPLVPEPLTSPIALGQLVWNGEHRVLYARPERALLQGRLYVLVVTTKVTDAERRRLRVSPDLLKPLDETDHPYAVNARITRALLGAGVKRADIAALALFTTQSVTADLERMRAVLEAKPEPAVTFDLAPGRGASVYPRAGLQSIELRRHVATSGMLLGEPVPLALNLLPPTEVKAIAFGRYRSPSFLSAEGHIPAVATAKPLAAPATEDEIHVTLFLPEGQKPPGGWPVASSATASPMTGTSFRPWWRARWPGTDSPRSRSTWWATAPGRKAPSRSCARTGRR